MNATTTIKPASGRAPLTLGSTGGENCLIFKTCGGHPMELIYKLGCANYHNDARYVNTGDMNPWDEKRFYELWDDVYGLIDCSVGKLKSIPAGKLPRYITQLQGKQFSRCRTLDLSIVALPLFQILVKKRNGGYGSKYYSGAALRAAYKLRPDTRIILVGVKEDQPLENCWAKHRSHNIGEELKRLDLLGVTVPNFSYFTNVSGFQIVRNFKRMLLMAERLSDAGVKVSPHLSANTPGHWRNWLEFLRDHPEVKTVTMEFQTGTLEEKRVEREVFDGLVNLQDSLGRPIHCFLVGAARLYHEACERLDNFTLIDSQPYMQAVNRFVLHAEASGRYFWKNTPTKIGAPITDLFETNLLLYGDKLNAHSGDEIEGSPCAAENVSDEQMSMPYFTAQPVAPEISERNSAATVSCQAEMVCHAPTV
jgi:hypothetical protein